MPMWFVQSWPDGHVSAEPFVHRHCEFLCAEMGDDPKSALEQAKREGHLVMDERPVVKGARDD